MELRNRIMRPLSLLIFGLGVLLGIVIFSLAVWADFEASLFAVTDRGEASLRTLRCPTVLAEGETGTIQATISNPLDRSTEFFVRAFISQGFVTLKRQVDDRVPLDSGERQTLEWDVAAQDAAYGGRLVLARVLLRGKYPHPSRGAACGILVQNTMGLSGNHFLILATVASLVSMGVGGGLWVVSARPLNEHRLAVTRAMGALGIVVMLGMIVGLMGWWFFGALVLMVTVLLIGSIIGYFFNQSRI